MKDEVIGFPKFCILRPVHIKLFEQIPHNVCVCEYHENICLILSVMENHTSLSPMFNDFVQQVTCDQTCKDCIYQHCDNCRDLLETFKPMPDKGALLTKYQQWQTCNKKTEKVFITATVDAIFDDLRSQLNGFLVHCYIKGMQAAHFTKLITEYGESSVILQLDFSENASLLQQNETRAVHWTHQQITIFTAHAWIGEGVKESFVIMSDSLNHTKEAVYTFMSVLFWKLSKKYTFIRTITVFSDGAASQFKEYLFPNLHGWEKKFSSGLTWIFLSHLAGIGAVDGIGGTVKWSA